MELIKCKSCGKELNKKATICPNCGVKIHPIKDIIKIFVIVFIVIIILCLGIFIFTGDLTRLITDIKNDNTIKKIEGTYELTNNTFEKLGNEISDIQGNYTINNEIEIKKDNTSFVEGIGLCLEEYKLIKLSQNKLLLITGFHMLAPYEDKHTDLDRIVCFNVEDNKLKQTNCPNNDDYAHFYIPNINLEYTKK